MNLTRLSVGLFIFAQNTLFCGDSTATQFSDHAAAIRNELKLDPECELVSSGRASTIRLEAIRSILSHAMEIAIHQMRGAYGNTVYMSPDGHQEAVFAPDKSLVRDGINDGSYNFFHPTSDALRHFLFDIHPWINWGTSPEDPTEVHERLIAYIQDIKRGIQATIDTDLSKANSNRSLRPGELEALALWLRIIEAGKGGVILDTFGLQGRARNEDINLLSTEILKGLEAVYCPKHGIYNSK